MAKPVQRTARKDYPAQGIKKGDRYWYVQLKTGPRSSSTLRQLTPFRPAQLTTSEYLRAVYEWDDALQDAADMDDVANLISDLEMIRDEQQEKFDNMPDGLQQGPTGELLEERVSDCDSAIDQITEWKDAFEAEEDPDLEDYLDRIKEVSVG